MSTNTETLLGVLDRFLYKNNENGFCVCVLTLDNNQTAMVRGVLSHIHPGETVSVQGTWTTHPKFGKQFEAEQCTARIPSSLVGLKKYLGSGLIKGVGPAYAEKLVTYFGTTVLDVIDKQPERLRLIPGLGAKRIGMILSAWEDQKSISHIMVFLQDKGISTAYAVKIYKKYGNNALAMVTENPYRLAQEVWGIGFLIADTIAQKMGIAPDSLKRVKAGILFAITNAVGNGHLYVELEALRAEAITLLALDDTKIPLVKIALHELHDTDAIVLMTYQAKHYVTQKYYYQVEKSVARRVHHALAQKQSDTDQETAIYTKLRTHHYTKQQLSDEQQVGIMASLKHKLSIITGGPGTGKTTLIKTLLAILDEQNKPYKLAAPTGRAAKRIHESTGKPATTIHRLLEFDPNSMSFTRTEKNPLELDFLIVDETSMIDIFLANALLRAVPTSAHVVLLGDIDQLPSVGAGNVLHDLIASELVPCTRLTHIFRQAQESLIITNAHRINNGEFPINDTTRHKPDYIFIKEDDPAAIATQLHKIYTRIVPLYGISPEHTITLVPMKKGIVGSYALNTCLQDILNPAPSNDMLRRPNEGIFKVGDRVMQVRNNYDKEVFNGDMGYIEHISTSEQSLIVRFPEQSIGYEAGELEELIPAYAISVHKSQGSEFDAVIVPLFMQHFALLQRNLLYTAITRAKKVCIFVGQSKAITIAIKNNKHKERCTFLKALLTGTVTCR
jgi:exodeoxyribonuclease V alpha subunit